MRATYTVRCPADAQYTFAARPSSKGNLAPSDVFLSLLGQVDPPELGHDFDEDPSAAEGFTISNGAKRMSRVRVASLHVGARKEAWLGRS